MHVPRASACVPGKAATTGSPQEKMSTYEAYFRTASFYGGPLKRDLFAFAARVGISPKDVQLDEAPGGGLITKGWSLRIRSTRAKLQKFSAGAWMSVFGLWAISDTFQRIR